MAESVVIPARFNGPPASGHGGYSAGLGAGLVDGTAEVRLRAPPPLETPMTVERHDDGSATLVSDGRVILEARPAELDVEPPGPVSPEQAEEATQDSFFLGPDHPFPTCFACGPQRAEGDGMRLFAGRVADSDVFAVPWTPATEFGTNGTVDPLFVWAALDCPSSAPLIAGERPSVLASLTVEMRAAVAVAEPHVIGSWKIERDGRKLHSGVVLWDAAGDVRALGRALWIELR